jgi:hypothetical protein
MAIPTLSGSYIDETYIRLVQVSGSEFADGLGNRITFGNGSLSGGINGYIPLWSGSTALSNSIISQTGNLLNVSGSISASNGLTGSLYGTASWAISSLTASYINPTFISASAKAAGFGVGGFDKQIQFNNGGTFGGNSLFTFNSANSSLQHGINVTGSGLGSHAQGNGTIAYGQYSHTQGANTYAIGEYSHAVGENASAGQFGWYSTQISSGVIILNPTLIDISSLFPSGSYIVLDDTGAGSIGINIFEVASSTWDGTNVTINLVDTTVSTTEAKIGQLGNANPGYGAENAFGGLFSHAEGTNTIALGRASHTEGNSTIALGKYQHIIGSFNKLIPQESAFIIGNGTSALNRSNLLMASGSQVQITGSLSISSEFTLNETLTKFAKYTNVGVGVANDITLFSIPTGSYTSAFGKYTIYSGSNSRAGELMTSRNGTTVNSTDVATNDIGSTSVVRLTSQVYQSYYQIIVSFPATGTWDIKMMATYI